MPRLLLRGPVLHTTHPSESEVPYWLNSAHPLLLSMFGPIDTETVDSRVIDSQYGNDYYLIVDDVVSKLVIGADDRIENDKPNRIRFFNALSKNIVDTSIYVKEATIGYVPTSNINSLLGIKLKEAKPMAKPAASIKGNGFVLDVSKTGGMELKVGKSRVFFETQFSYPNKPIMQFNTFTVDGMTGEPGITASVKADGTVNFRTKSLSVKRSIKSCGHYIRVIDNITNVSKKDVGLVWKNNFFFSGKMPETWRIGGLTGCQALSSRGAANPTIFLSDTVSTAVGVIAEDTVSRNLIDMRTDGNVLSLGSQGVGIQSGKTLVVDWTIYPLKKETMGYFDFINQVREDWGLNKVTIPGPFHWAFDGMPDLKLQFGFVGKWHYYANGWPVTDEQYVKEVQGIASGLRKRFPGIKLLGRVETNLVPFKVTDYEWGSQLPLTHGNRQDPRSKYGQYLSPELSKKLVAATPYRDSMLWNDKGGVMIDNWYTYSNHDTINLMVQVETDNYRYKKFMEQIDLIMDKGGLNGLYIDQFNPTARDGLDYSKWDGYSVVLDKSGEIVQKYYNFAITGAEGRMKIIKQIVDKGGIAFTNGHPVTREEQNSGRLSFAEMENDGVNPVTYLDKIPPETLYTASGHLASPIILNLRPSRYTSVPADSPDNPRARYLTKGFILALRNGNIPYYYTSDIPLTGPNAGSFEITNWFMPFTPVKLGEGVMVGKERTLVCISGTYTVKGGKKPSIAKFNNCGRPVEHNFAITGKPGAWNVKVTLDDWNEIAAIKVED